MQNPSKTATEAVPDWLFAFIRCPISHTSLSPASEAFMKRLSIRHHERPLITRGGRTISDVPTQGLLSGDGCWLFPVHGEIPTLIPDEAIAVSESTHG